MNDLISRQAAIDVLRTCYDTEAITYTNGDEYINYDQALDLMEGLPPAQPERKNGKWIPVDSFSAFGGDEVTWMVHGNPVAFYFCSGCKEHAYAGEDGESILSDFCPNCGADMRGEQDDSISD